MEAWDCSNAPRSWCCSDAVVSIRGRTGTTPDHASGSRLRIRSHARPRHALHMTAAGLRQNVQPSRHGVLQGLDVERHHGRRRRGATPDRDVDKNKHPRSALGIWAKRTGGAMYQGTVGKAFPARCRTGIPSDEPTGRGSVDDFGRRSLCKPSKLSLRKEVIQPQVPLRLPCYDLVPVTSLAVGTPELRRLRALPASMT